MINISSKLHSQIWNQLGNDLCDQCYIRIDSQLYLRLRGQLRSRLPFFDEIINFRN